MKMMMIWWADPFWQTTSQSHSQPVQSISHSYILNSAFKYQKQIRNTMQENMIEVNKNKLSAWCNQWCVANKTPVFNNALKIKRKWRKQWRNEEDEQANGVLQVWVLASRAVNWKTLVFLPLLLLLIHRHAARAESDHQQQASDDRRGLKEVVFQEVVHGFVGRHCPESVEVDVDGQKPHHQRERRQFGLESDGHQDDESRSHHVLKNLGNKNRIELQLVAFSRLELDDDVETFWDDINNQAVEIWHIYF